MSKKYNQNLTRRPIKGVKNENTNSAVEEEEEETDSEITDDETPKKLYPEIPKDDDSFTVESAYQLPENQYSRKKIESSLQKKITSVKETPENSKEKSSCGISAVCIIGVVISSVLGFYLMKCFWSQSLPFSYSQLSPSFYSPSLNVADILLTMKESFSEQDSKIFKILESALNTINSISEPKSPAILLLVSVGDSESISLKFSHQLAKSISEQPIVISGKQLSKQKPGDAKIEICDTLKSKIMVDNLSVILLHNLEQISFESAQILHSYCDHENAPFKRVVYVMTASCQHQKVTSKWDEIADQCLKEAWKSANEEEVAALLSRITVRVMLIQPSKKT